jgi:hypothetical protein
MMLTTDQKQTAESLRDRVARWVQEEGDARSTLAGAIVIIDALKRKAPLSEEDIFTGGGQIVGGRGRALKETLSGYGFEPFLKDGVTTRSTRKFERLAEYLDWGKPLTDWGNETRQEAVEVIIKPVLEEIGLFFQRQHLKLRLDLQESPSVWIEELFQVAKDRSQGRIEQHLVGAKLERRLPGQRVSEQAAFAGDAQTGRSGDFVIGQNVFHVTAVPGTAVIEKCRENLRQGLRPILVVPKNTIERAKGLASFEGELDRRISFVAIEDFLALNIIELASEAGESFIDVLRAILSIYNQRIAGSETDLSLRIEID